ncbi:class I SAM-dependent methyltransferase [Kiloniella laminariae]|uniref:class I SAM-dependent methyltransferase n=1 Tax=Kiloniella laminariae TaxID=454162 RepID=UPI000382D2FC|nr:class I SAM-dependent methyltransferase [Kiloniella laminariae]
MRRLIRKFLYFISRTKPPVNFLIKQAKLTIFWLKNSNENTNYTYDLEEKNKLHLAFLISAITNSKFEIINSYITEICDDEELKKHISSHIAKSSLSFMADQTARYGRRVGWYAIVRALKPNIVVETGVDKGLGACVLTAALKKNHIEGNSGYYYGTDINPKAGYMLSGSYAEFGEIIYGDSIESLKNLNHTIDIFINDSDHSNEYEACEYRTISNKLSKRSVILGDNSHSTNELLEFSLKNNRDFIFFCEKPEKHWYPGAGIGISYSKRNDSQLNK